MKMNIHLSIWILILTSLGCSTVKLSSLDYSIADIQKGVVNTGPAGLAKISANGRSYTTKHFDPNKYLKDRTLERSQETDRERAVLIATVLGDRRPYDVEIEVVVEEDLADGPVKKNDDFVEGKWSKAGKDKGLAELFKQRLANYLARLERSKNLIDDFRPF